MKAILPHAFGDHQQCQDHKLNWCEYIKNPDQCRHKDLQAERTYRAKDENDLVKKLVSNASPQINESWHSTVGSKAPKTRFYDGCESSDQRVAADLARTNLGKQYVLDTLRCLNVEPGDIREKNILSLDKEREAEKHRKSFVKFKKERMQDC